MSSKILVVAIATVGAIALSACGPELEVGMVENKRYTDEYTLTTYTKVGEVQVPVFTTYPEEFEVYVCSDVDLDRICEWWSVTSEAYNASENGDILRLEEVKG